MASKSSPSDGSKKEPQDKDEASQASDDDDDDESLHLNIDEQEQDQLSPSKTSSISSPSLASSSTTKNPPTQSNDSQSKCTFTSATRSSNRGSESNKPKQSKAEALASEIVRQQKERIVAKNRFCQCEAEWEFESLRGYILKTQKRRCPQCHARFTNLRLKEKPMTACHLLFSLQGLLIIVTSLLQYSILYYGAYLGFINVKLARQLPPHLAERFSSLQPDILFWLTILFVLVCTYNMFRSIYDTAQALTDQVVDKLILDVVDVIEMPQH